MIFSPSVGFATGALLALGFESVLLPWLDGQDFLLLDSSFLWLDFDLELDEVECDFGLGGFLVTDLGEGVDVLKPKKLKLFGFLATIVSVQERNSMIPDLTGNKLPG